MSLEQVMELDDPNRCQASNRDGQCRFLRAPGIDMCEAHGAMKLAAQKRDTLKNYRLQRYNDRLMEKKGSNEIKGLREEIAILRMTLEEVLLAADVKQSPDENGILLFSPRITALVDQITKTIVACHTLEEKTGNVLDKSKVLIIADAISSIVSRYISDSVILEKISSEIGSNIESICNQGLTVVA